MYDLQFYIRNRTVSVYYRPYIIMGLNYIYKYIIIIHIIINRPNVYNMRVIRPMFRQSRYMIMYEFVRDFAWMHT